MVQAIGRLLGTDFDCEGMPSQLKSIYSISVDISGKAVHFVRLSASRWIGKQNRFP